jgi:hypothetical protein
MRASGYDRHANDWDREPRWIVDALLDREALVGMTWDPACGGGTIPKVIQARDLPAISTDIMDCGNGRHMDFLGQSSELPTSFPNIISNPPYGIIEPWIIRALERTTEKVCILARLAFLESQRRRDGLFRDHPISRVWVSSRHASMPPGGSKVPAREATIAYAWFVWDHA